MLPCRRGGEIEEAVAETFIKTISPTAREAALLAKEIIKADHDAALEHWSLQVERIRYEATQAERRFRIVELENQLVARTLETQWE